MVKEKTVQTGLCGRGTVYNCMVYSVLYYTLHTLLHTRATHTAIHTLHTPPSLSLPSLSPTPPLSFPLHTYKQHNTTHTLSVCLSCKEGGNAYEESVLRSINLTYSCVSSSISMLGMLEYAAMVLPPYATQKETHETWTRQQPLSTNNNNNNIKPKKNQSRQIVIVNRQLPPPTPDHPIHPSRLPRCYSLAILFTGVVKREMADGGW